MEKTKVLKASNFPSRKTFFVGADSNIVPDIYLESFLALGLETYRIFEQHSAPDIADRLDLIVSLFSNVIFVFYVDAFTDDTDWKLVLHSLRQNHADIALGVMYTERAIERENKAVEYSYSQFCGADFARLSFQRSKNFKSVATYLSRLGAGGMRRTVRSLCSPQSTVTFFDDGTRTEAFVQDVSLSHFSCIVPDDTVILKQYLDVVLQINGTRFFADCIFMAERKTSLGRLSVFAFVRKNGEAGLDDASLFRLRPKLYQMVTQNAIEELKEAFTLRTKLLISSEDKDSINANVLDVLRSEKYGELPAC